MGAKSIGFSSFGAAGNAVEGRTAAGKGLRVELICIISFWQASKRRG